MLISFIDLFFLFFFSLATTFTMRKFAKKIGLVDKPSVRKLHDGTIPLVGGVSICISILYFLFNNPEILPNAGLYATCLLILVSIGVLDDMYDLNFQLRFAVQAGLSIIMMVVGDIELNTIGDIFGSGDVITLGWFGYFITTLAVVGAINAFNMVDGIDGLLGGLSIVTFGGLGIMLNFDGQSSLAYICLVLIVTIIPYILLNLGMFGRKRKVFMGDAGSMLIGFTVIWLLLLSSQNGSAPPLRPVTALWLIAIPLMDMAAIMFKRIRRGDSPFKPDREHLHHIFQRLGFTSRQTLAIICLLASGFASFGIYGELLGIAESTMFILFMLCFTSYTVAMCYIWRITSWIRDKV